MQSNTSSSVSPGNGHCGEGAQQGGPPTQPPPNLGAPAALSIQHSPRPPASHRAARPAPTSPQPVCRPPESAPRGPGTLGCHRRCSSGPQSRFLPINIHTDASVLWQPQEPLVVRINHQPLGLYARNPGAEPCPTPLEVGTVFMPPDG